LTIEHASAPRSTSLIWRLVIAAVFAAAGIAKISDPTSFLAAILGYHLPLSAPILKLAALVVPWLELFSGLFLAFGIWLDAAWIAVSGLSLVFVAVALQAAVRGISIQCGCFGSLSERMPNFMNSLPFVLGRDVFLASATIAMAWRYLRWRPSDSAGKVGLADVKPCQLPRE
jgi:uncharacterized membrane protein YphA (DoxX/SURF4 family)